MAVLDPRIYRTGLVAVALAVLVLAFSLDNQQGPLSTTLAPEAFNGGHAYATMNRLARQHPDRRPGSAADGAIANEVTRLMSSNGFFVSRSRFEAQTADGRRTLENVTGVRPGTTPGSIVIVAHRDALHPRATAEASGTAVLEELTHVLSGETHRRTIVLASTSGSSGTSGALELARSLGQPVDAVVVLGDLAGTVCGSQSWSHGPTARRWRRRCCETRSRQPFPSRPSSRRNRRASGVSSRTSRSRSPPPNRARSAASASRLC